MCALDKRAGINVDIIKGGEEEADPFDQSRAVGVIDQHSHSL